MMLEDASVEGWQLANGITFACTHEAMADSSVCSLLTRLLLLSNDYPSPYQKMSPKSCTYGSRVESEIDGLVILNCICIAIKIHMVSMYPWMRL